MIDTVLRIAPFTVRVRSPFASVRRHIEIFYSGRAVGAGPGFVDFDVRIARGRGIRRWVRPQSRFLLDNFEPFLPLDAGQAGPMVEWGLNWAVAQRALGYLVMHAAVVAKAGRAIVMPGFPGAGKSTLCASLVLLGGWRLFSDELAIVEPTSARLVPHPRPISVKNEAIDIVARFPGAHLGPTYVSARKGLVSHVACPGDVVAGPDDTAGVHWVCLPTFRLGAEPLIEPISRVEAFTLMSEQAFNAERMGRDGFDALCRLLDGAQCYQLTYGSTEDGLDLVRRITAS